MLNKSPAQMIKNTTKVFTDIVLGNEFQRIYFRTKITVGFYPIVSRFRHNFFKVTRSKIEIRRKKEKIITIVIFLY